MNPRMISNDFDVFNNEPKTRTVHGYFSLTSQTTTTLQEEIAAAQRKLNACRDFGERRRLVGYIQGLNTALYVISQQRETAVELPY